MSQGWIGLCVIKRQILLNTTKVIRSLLLSRIFRIGSVAFWEQIVPFSG